MAARTASVTLGGHLRFSARAASGHSVVLDGSLDGTGMRLSELIPLAAAGCTAMDVISILRKKRQNVTHYEVQATGVQQDVHPNVFTRIDILHVVEGFEIDIEAVRHAIELSATKYCRVGATLSSGVTEIRHAYLVRGAAGEWSDEVIVLGPGANPPDDAAMSLAAAG